MVVGNTLGESCVALSGSGQTDTATVFVVPRTIEVAVAATVGSGATETATLSFLDLAGNPATGFSASDVVFSVGSGSVADVDATGAVTGKSPGTTNLNVSLASRWGAPRTASASFTVVPGPFGGSIYPRDGELGRHDHDFGSCWDL